MKDTIFPTIAFDPLADRKAANEAGVSLVSAGQDHWIVAELPGELVALGDWSFYRQSRAIYGPASRDDCERFIGDRIGSRLKVGKHAPAIPVAALDEMRTTGQSA